MLKTTIRIQGHGYEITRDDIIHVARGNEPDPIKTYSVEVKERKYPPKQVIRSGPIFPITGATTSVSQGDDVAVVWPVPVDDKVGESADGELACSGAASSWGTSLWVSFDQLESTGDCIEQPGTPSWSALFVPPHCFSEFARTRAR